MQGVHFLLLQHFLLFQITHLHLLLFIHPGAYFPPEAMMHFPSFRFLPISENSKKFRLRGKFFQFHLFTLDETTAPSTVAASGNAIGPEHHVIAEGYRLVM